MRIFLIAFIALAFGCSRRSAEQKSSVEVTGNPTQQAIGDAANDAQRPAHSFKRAEEEITRLQRESAQLGPKADDGMDVFTDLFVERQKRRAAGDLGADEWFVKRVEGKSLIDLAPKR